MKIVIHSDGTPSGTLVLTESGEQIENVTAVSFSISNGYVGEVDITVAQPSVNLVGEFRGFLTACRGCGESIDHECAPALGRVDEATVTVPADPNASP